MKMDRFFSCFCSKKLKLRPMTKVKWSKMLTPNAMVRAVTQFHATVTMIKWGPRYAEGNVKWLNTNFIFIMFHNKISCSVPVFCFELILTLNGRHRKTFFFLIMEISFKNLISNTALTFSSETSGIFLLCSREIL